jgi:hypothetical protein
MRCEAELPQGSEDQQAYQPYCGINTHCNANAGCGHSH